MPSRKKSSKELKDISSRSEIQKEPRKSKRPLLLIFVILGLGILIYAFSKWAVLVWVDGQPITRFEYYQKLEEGKAGQEIKDQMIVEKLVYSEGNKKGINAGQKEINQEFKKVQQQIGTESMKLQLTQVGMTEADFKKQLETRIIIRKLFGKNIKVTDADVNKYIEDQKVLYGEQAGEMPELTQIEKNKLKEELFLQKVQENFSKWVSEVQKSSRVLRN